jgi:hypothetical protein
MGLSCAEKFVISVGALRVQAGAEMTLGRGGTRYPPLASSPPALDQWRKNSSLP